MDKQTEMESMMNQYLAHTYKDKNVLKVQKCRWKKRLLVEKDGLGSSATLINMLEFMIYQKNIYNKFIKFIMFNNSINMPYKTGKLKGLLTSAEIRKLIVSHNKLVKLSIPKGSNRDDLIKLIAKNGYRINHAKGVIEKGGGLLKQPPPAKKQTSFKSQVATTKPYVLSKKEKNEKIKTIEKIDKDKKENKNNKNLEEQIKDSWDQDELNYKKQYNTLVKKYSKNELVESDKAKLTKLFNDIKEDYITIDDGVIQEEMKSWSPIVKVMKNIKKIIASIDKKPPAKKVSVVKPADMIKELGGDLPTENYGGQSTKGKSKKDLYPAYVPTEADKKKDKLIKDLEIVSTRLKETLLKNKNNFGFNSDPVNTNKDFKQLFQQLVTQLHTKDLKKLPVIMENIKSIVNTINAYPPKDNEGIKSPLIKYPALSDRTDPKNFKNFINEKSRLSRNKILKERRDALKPKKEVVKKPTKEDKALQKKNDYDEDIERRLKKLDDDVKSNKNVFGEFAGNKQGDFMKLFTEIYKLGRGIVPKDFSSKSMEYAKNLLNIVYSNPPKDREGLIMPEKAFGLNGIFKPWKKFLNEDKKPAVKKEVKKPADMTKELGGDLPTENYGGQSTQSKPKPKPAVKKPPIKKPVTEEVFTDSEEEEPMEITAMNHPLTKKLIAGVQSLRNKIKKDAKADPSKLTSIKVIARMTRPIAEFVRNLQRDNNVEFSSNIIVKFEDDLIENLIDDLKEIAGLK